MSPNIVESNTKENNSMLFMKTAFSRRKIQINSIVKTNTEEKLYSFGSIIDSQNSLLSSQSFTSCTIES